MHVILVVLKNFCKSNNMKVYYGEMLKLNIKEISKKFY